MDHAPTASPLSTFSDDIAALVRRASRSVVGVRSHRSQGSGFAWRPGLIVTADENVTDEDRLAVVLPGGATVLATLKGRDPSTDVALLRVDAPALEPITATTRDVVAGSLAVVVGADDGAPVAALGIVARAGPAWRSLRGGNVDARIEVDTLVRGSSEGGVAFDATGRAIGMAVFGPRRRVLVIPASTIDRVAAKLDADGRIARGYLGLGLQGVRIENGGVGAMVMSVDADGPGVRAGIRQGDVIAAWNGHAIDGVNDLLRELGPDSVGSVVRLAASRGGEPMTFDVTIGARPER
ncbi:MAG TPA: S1C family serine protease [Casimicrobiaceae bacterium]|jgi:S1-C subfamily serine protease|nr:S1C family serine protease [Casimicrobiaceae bacterium]